MVLSVWGMVQLTIMGLLYLSKSVALIEDLGLKEASDYDKDSPIPFYQKADQKYESVGYNCLYAVSLYLLTFGIALHQYYSNVRLNV